MQALRNIKYTLRKYFVPMLMSLIGLILAFSAFMLISVQLDFEKGFDRFHPDAGNIYRVDLSDNNTIFRSILPPGFSDEVIRSSSHIVAGTVVCPFLGEVYITTMKDGVSSGFIETANVVSEDFFKVFGIKIVEGDPATLSKNEQLAIPQSTARKIFGNESPIGKQVKIKSGTGFLRSDKWTVGAVYEDLPANSQIRNEIYMKIPDFFLQNFGASNFVCYLRLDDSENVSLVEDEFNSKFEFDKYSGLTPIYLTPLVDVYFQEEKSDGRVFRSGSLTQYNVLTIISFLIIIVGLLNFTNFYTSLIPSRLKTINTRIILGEDTRTIRMEIIQETVLLSLIAFVGAVIAVVFLSPAVTEMGIVNTVFCFEKNSSIVIITLLLALSGGILSGIYPAFFATSYTGELAMRGNFNLSSSGMKIKKTLLCVQYAISCSLILFIAAIYLQNRMMLQFDPKFDKDRIAIVGLTSDIVKNKGAWIKEELQKYPEIENVAFTSERFGAHDTYCTEGIEYNGTDIPSFLIYVTPDFPEVMGIKMTEGKTFPKTSKGDIIVNRYMKDNYGMELGNIPSMEAEAIGICDNVNFTSMRKSQSAVCFISLPAESGYLSDMFVRLSSGYDRTAVVSHIKEIISKVEPEYPTEVLFYDNVAAAQYQRENSFANTMLCFSIIAIVLSLVGVFSMVIFDIQHKRKEIALRKVFGADYTDVLWLGNKPYFFIVLAGFIISIPVAVIAINEYLQGFAMKVNVSWWIFLLVFLFIQVLTAILVVVRYNSLALESPNISLETE